MDDLVELDDFQELDGAVKEKERAEHQPLNPQDAPFPFDQFMALYFRANPDQMHMNWCEGLKALYAWLAPISLPSKIEWNPLHLALITYDLQQVAKLLGCSYEVLFWLMVAMQRKNKR